MYPKIALLAAFVAAALAAPVNVQERQLDAVGGLLGGVTGTSSADGASSSGAAGGSGGLLEPVVSVVFWREGPLTIY